MAAEALRALIVLWFTSHGYQDWQADALARHFYVESRFSYTVVANTGSSCLGQWIGSRRRELYQRSHTSRCPSLVAQLEFVDHELREVSTYRGFWRQSPATVFFWLRRCYGHGHCR